ncbi:hypothetical protein CRI94_16450 [Longibacter salinarum]|uniref:Uncharacterized protein n=1 Tax=Longibacter salinarum TaxID=1850348 RepID=A0A2A8CTW1_9BACT|nr:hypothetical protein CRI94_16450 [Longibacter salinarum]
MTWHLDQWCRFGVAARVSGKPAEGRPRPAGLGVLDWTDSVVLNTRADSAVVRSREMRSVKKREATAEAFCYYLTSSLTMIGPMLGLTPVQFMFTCTA